MSREINLDGGEISVIKAIGLSGTHISGEQLMERVPEFDEAELIDTLEGLIMTGYVISDKQSLHTKSELEHANFNVNSGYMRELREALDPHHKPEKRSRRVRRE